MFPTLPSGTSGNASPFGAAPAYSPAHPAPAALAIRPRGRRRASGWSLLRRATQIPTVPPCPPLHWPRSGPRTGGHGCLSLPRGENVRAVWGRPCALTRSPGPGRTGHPAAWPSPGFGVALVAACYATKAQAAALLPRRKHGHQEKQSRRISAAGGDPAAYKNLYFVQFASGRTEQNTRVFV